MAGQRRLRIGRGGGGSGGGGDLGISGEGEARWEGVRWGGWEVVGQGRQLLLFVFFFFAFSLSETSSLPSFFPVLFPLMVKTSVHLLFRFALRSWSFEQFGSGVDRGRQCAFLGVLWSGSYLPIVEMQGQHSIVWEN